ncbi:MAG TPA: hypothetical protein VHS30_28710 [Streptosporangiaceae bacterium]|nr:hypothetical protein [Streptosporangiaceae bacterium]
MRGEPAASGDDLEGGPAQRAARAVKYHVGPVARGELAYLPGPAGLGVVDDRIGARVADHGQLAAAAGGADDPPAGRPGQLDHDQHDHLLRSVSPVR